MQKKGLCDEWSSHFCLAVELKNPAEHKSTPPDSGLWVFVVLACRVLLLVLPDLHYGVYHERGAGRAARLQIFTYI